MENPTEPSEISSSLQLPIWIRQPALVCGAFGVGESKVVGQVAAALGLRLIDTRPFSLDPVDLRELPTVEYGKAASAIQALLQEDSTSHPCLDELNAAQPLAQAAFYKLVLDRAIGEYRPPDDRTLLAVGNREGNRAVASRISSAPVSCFVHLTFDTDLDDWSAGWCGRAICGPKCWPCRAGAQRF